MPFASIEAYMSRLEVRMAEVKLMMADVVSLPNMKKNDRRSTLNRWMKIVKISSNEQVKPASRARLRLMGIGVSYVEPGQPG